MDPLSAAALMKHVQVLAGEIGPRPAGHEEELQARSYISKTLVEIGLGQAEELPFPTWDTWGYSLAVPLVLAQAGNFLGALGRGGHFLSGLATLANAVQVIQASAAMRQPLGRFYPARQTADLIVRIPAQVERRRTVVLLGHTDSNKHRLSFTPQNKKLLLPFTSISVLGMFSHAAGQILQAAGKKRTGRILHAAGNASMAFSLAVALADELGGYVPGASDNASAVACLLGLGAQLQQHPLAYTEVWLVFTGAEEPGCLGTHHLLDVYGEQLLDAWFIDFEMVTTPNIAYVTRHSSLTAFGKYEPDPESLALAEETSRCHPELQVQGQEMVITEEVGALRRRGYRGICLVGVGEDGWLSNWHQYSDDVEHVHAEGMERAARFARAMLDRLDGSQVE